MEESKKKIFDRVSMISCLAIGVAVTIQKLYIVSFIQCKALATAACDDRLMVNQAVNILSGEWLGKYTDMTLVKGMFYPLYLALIHRLGGHYFTVTTILYAMACLLFCMCIRKICKSNVVLLLIYIVMLFNPVMVSSNVFTRIYRCALTPIQCLLLFAGFFGMYLCIGEKKIKQLFWAIIAGIGYGTMYLTREDTIWVFPFIFVITVILLVLTQYQKQTMQKRVINFFIVMTPFLIFGMLTCSVRFMNEKYYGEWVCNEVSETKFPDAVRAIYAVEDPEDIDQVSVSRKKIELLYQNSETLNIMKDYMEESLVLWTGDDATEITDAHFYWALRTAARMAGAYNSSEISNELYTRIANEVNQAMDEGRLQRRNTMPSALMSPYRERYFNAIKESLFEVFRYLYDFDGTRLAYEKASEDDGLNGVTLFEELTREKAFRGEEVTPITSELKHTVEVLKKIRKLYIGYGAYVWRIAILGTVLAALYIGIKREWKQRYFKVWLMQCAVLLSMVVLAVGIAYTNVTAYSAINASYLSGGYALVLMFETLSFICSAQILLCIYREVRKKGKGAKAEVIE